MIKKVWNAAVYLSIQWILIFPRIFIFFLNCWHFLFRFETCQGACSNFKIIDTIPLRNCVYKTLTFLLKAICFVEKINLKICILWCTVIMKNALKRREKRWNILLKQFHVEKSSWQAVIHYLTLLQKIDIPNVRQKIVFLFLVKGLIFQPE